ncbi:hypothetical protein ACIGEP_14615 [Microbacterium sp. NPDC077663]|uniref:hypothetical protein n=1 Tax=Microbacterium sp. NPDC077663 TaxID=3364189 RepID=UPI0037C9AA4B
MSTPDTDGIRLDPADAPLGDTTVGDTEAADAEFEGRPLDDDAGEAPEEPYADSGIQPESQGEDPLIAEMGEDGDGELAPEDL